MNSSHLLVSTLKRWGSGWGRKGKEADLQLCYRSKQFEINNVSVLFLLAAQKVKVASGVFKQAVMDQQLAELQEMKSCSPSL